MTKKEFIQAAASGGYASQNLARKYCRERVPNQILFSEEDFIPLFRWAGGCRITKYDYARKRY